MDRVYFDVTSQGLGGDLPREQPSAVRGSGLHKGGQERREVFGELQGDGLDQSSEH